MVLGGNSVYVAHVWRKIGLFKHNIQICLNLFRYVWIQTTALTDYMTKLTLIGHDIDLILPSNFNPYYKSTFGT